MVRASRSHRGGRWFESNLIHQNKKRGQTPYFILVALEFLDEETTVVGSTTSESQTEVWRSALPMSAVEVNDQSNLIHHQKLLMRTIKCAFKIFECLAVALAKAGQKRS